MSINTRRIVLHLVLQRSPRGACVDPMRPSLHAAIDARAVPRRRCIVTRLPVAEHSACTLPRLVAWRGRLRHTPRLSPDVACARLGRLGVFAVRAPGLSPARDATERGRVHLPRMHPARMSHGRRSAFTRLALRCTRVSTLLAPGCNILYECQDMLR